MSLYTKALILATRAHAGQKRLNGNNYIIHPIRVSQEVSTERQKVIALLHDVVEDTEIPLEEIQKEFGDEVAVAIDCLTRREGEENEKEDYDDYIKRVLTNKDAIAVKIADIADNLSDSPSSHAIEKSARSITLLVKAKE